MPNAQMNFRIDAELKKLGDERFATFGCTSSQAMRRLYEVAASYDTKSEELLQSLIGSQEVSVQSEGEKRAQAVKDFEAHTRDFYASLGITRGLSQYAETNEELREMLYDAQLEKMGERGLL